MLHCKVHQYVKHCKHDLLVIIFLVIIICMRIENMHVTYIFHYILLKYNRISMRIMLFDLAFIIEIS